MFIPIGVFLSGCSCIIFHYDYNEDALFPTVLGLLVSVILSLMIPLIHQFKKLWKFTCKVSHAKEDTLNGSELNVLTFTEKSGKRA